MGLTIEKPITIQKKIGNINMFGLTVQDVIDALSELGPEERSKYLVDGQNRIINTVKRYWVNDKRLGNCIRFSADEINWGKSIKTTLKDPEWRDSGLSFMD